MNKKIKYSVSGRIRILPVLFLVIAFMSVCFCSCGDIRIEDDINISSVNSGSENAVVGYTQALFTGDRDKFNATMPTEALDGFSEIGIDPYEIMSEAVTDDLSELYIGVQYRTYNEYTEENGYDRDSMLSSICIMHSVNGNGISEIRVSKVSVCFRAEDDDKKYDTIDLYLINYCYNGSWYVFEMQNSDAQFAA